MAGHPCRLTEILATARQHGIKVVEDAAHSFGTRLDGTLLGGFGDATVFSFYATKNFTTGDGGLVTTQDPDLAEKVRMLSFHGMDGNAWQRYSGRGSWYYEVVEYGFKYHLGDPAAALGLVQLRRADEFLARRTEIAARYSEALADLPGVLLPEQADWATHAWHLYVLRVDPQRIREGRDGLIDDLQFNGLGSSVHFIPLYKHPVWARGGLPAEGLVEAEKYFHSCVSLPLFPAMTEDEIEDVITVVRRSLTDRRS
jgi:perosamine synthetase